MQMLLLLNMSRGKYKWIDGCAIIYLQYIIIQTSTLCTYELNGHFINNSVPNLKTEIEYTAFWRVSAAYTKESRKSVPKYPFERYKKLM